MVKSMNYNLLSPTKRRKLREEYVIHQLGQCKHCDCSLSGSPPKRITDLPINMNLFPPGFLHHPVHLHHDHTTGMTIGAVHAYCNAVLWQYHKE